ncbi:MAG TPA: dihydropteroate synthase [Longimicrobiales bacterium]|nr:dihydropteroate synthase [Longimicrobiales bacterium]
MSPPAAGFSWRTGRGVIHYNKPCVMGILNVTPDSFYDGGIHQGVAAALHHTAKMLEEGADIIDVGGESTRPGASPVDAKAESERIVPVVTAIAREFPDAVISVDTVKSEVARAASDAGAAIINDVSGLRVDPAIAGICGERELGLVLMHSRGDVADMASFQHANYGEDPVGDVIAELGASIEKATRARVTEDQIVLDPGLGFAKRTEHSLAMLAHLDRLAYLGFPILIGASRKRFIGELSGGLPVEQRLEGTLGAVVAALAKGAAIFRVHDVAAVRRALDVGNAILSAG